MFIIEIVKNKTKKEFTDFIFSQSCYKEDIYDLFDYIKELERTIDTFSDKAINNEILILEEKNEKLEKENQFLKQEISDIKVLIKEL